MAAAIASAAAIAAAAIATMAAGIKNVGSWTNLGAADCHSLDQTRRDPLCALFQASHPPQLE
jgi:hypothetical protein